MKKSNKVNISELTEADKGRKVIYIPRHAFGDVNHRDCERGIISSWGPDLVFVRYTTGDTAAGTRPEFLVFA